MHSNVQNLQNSPKYPKDAIILEPPAVHMKTTRKHRHSNADQNITTKKQQNKITVDDATKQTDTH